MSLSPKICSQLIRWKIGRRISSDITTGNYVGDFLPGSFWKTISCKILLKTNKGRLWQQRVFVHDFSGNIESVT